MFENTRFRLAVSVAGPCLAIATLSAAPALAQSAPLIAAAEAAAAAGGAAAAKEDEGAIVVTGSRIARRAIDSISPTQVLDSKALDARGFSTVAEALNELPSFGVPGASPVGFGQSSFGAGQSFVNFLGLGSQRTLTLVNGLRFVSSNTGSIFGPTGTGGNQVDLNTIPTKLIDRVETVAAIGAPIYGSDAVAGTINIILKKDFEGVDVDAQYGISPLGDAPNYRFRALVGKNFNDGRGNITVSGEYQDSKGLLFTDRAATTADNRYDAPNTPGAFRQVKFTDFRVPSISTSGSPLVGDFINTSAQQSSVFGFAGLNFGVAGPGGTQLAFNPSGVLAPIDFGSTIGSLNGFSVFTSGGNTYKLPTVQNLQTDLKRYSTNVQLNYELTDNIHLFAEGWYSVSQGKNLASQPTYQSALFDGAGAPSGNLIIPLNNPFLTAAARSAIQNAIATNPLADSPTQDYFYLARANFDVTPGVSTGKVDILRFVGGVDADVHVLKDKDWKLTATVNYGRSITTSSNPELVQKNFENALNASTDASGAIVCAPGAVNSPIATISSTCAPLNPFGNNISQAAKNYVTTIARPRNLNTQFDAIVSIAGPLVTLPGGDLAYALGYEHRQETSNFNPGAFYLGYPTTDANGNLPPSADRLSYGRSVPIDPVYGRYHTNEIFGELNAGIVSPAMDVKFVHELSFNSAARYVWNSLAGKDLTWTAGGRYAPASFLVFRGAYTRAIRAPSTTEAFNPTSSAFGFAIDSCDQNQITFGPNPAARAANCAAAGVPTNFNAQSNQRSFPTYTFGNPNLTSEKSDNFTIGAVLTPAFARGLSVTVDYVDITLKNAISQFSNSQVVAACYDSSSYPNNPFCGLVSRDPNSKELNNVGTTFFNSAKLKYKGILADVRYLRATPFLGADSQMSFAVSYQYLDTLTNQIGIGSGVTNIAGIAGYSHHKGTLTVNYFNGGFNTQIQAQYIGSALINANVPAGTYSEPNIGAVTYINASLSYDVTKNFTLRASVDNLFNQGPPKNALYSTDNNANPQQTYFSGIIGRYLRVSAGYHF